MHYKLRDSKKAKALLIFFGFFSYKWIINPNEIEKMNKKNQKKSFYENN